VVEQPEGALSVYRVLDLADIKGAYCTKLLADQGAEVIKVESPQGGSPTRSIPPFAGDEPHVERSLQFLYRDANKFGITLDVELPDGRLLLKRLAKTADVLVETYPPGYMESLGLDYEVLKEVNPGLVMASITDFGQTGPYRDWKGSGMVHCALSTTMISSGFADGAPINLPGTPSYDAASLIAAISIMTALYQRATTGLGQYCDVSVHESSRLGLYPWMVPIYSYGLNPGSPPPPPEGRLGAAIYPVYPCKDGFVRIVAITPPQWKALVRVLGEPEVLRLPEWQEFMYRIANAADLYALMLEFTAKYTMAELFEAGDREGVPIAPIYNLADFANGPNAKAREFFVEMDHPVAGKFDCPGAPYKWTGTPCRIGRPAPCLGEHNERVYIQELGLTKDDLAALRLAGVI
jgi:crotonobetainyl-CoA:carnitine CoA-transferase CaiB-like acyl-CoA transferase